MGFTLYVRERASAASASTRYPVLTPALSRHRSALTLSQNLVKVTLLVANAGAVLHPQRFLRKCARSRATRHFRLRASLAPSNSLSRADLSPFFADGMENADGSGGVKSQLSTAFAAMRQLRWPLLIMNLLVVVIELLFG